jgi:hypothetical protein
MTRRFVLAELVSDLSWPAIRPVLTRQNKTFMAGVRTNVLGVTPESEKTMFATV